jgi:hypothetical protein
MVSSSAGLAAKSECAGEAQKHLYDLLPERATHNKKPQMSEDNFREEKDKFVTGH